MSAAADVAAHVVRYYTRVGLLQPVRDPANGYKLFTDVHLKRLKFIRKAQDLGYTLAEIRAILGEADKGRSPCPKVRDIIRQRIRDNRLRLRELEALQRRMERALRAWERLPDGVPDGEHVCHLIESGAVDERPAAKRGRRA